jgi:hypothetical protein
MDMDVDIGMGVGIVWVLFLAMPLDKSIGLNKGSWRSSVSVEDCGFLLSLNARGTVKSSFFNSGTKEQDTSTMATMPNKVSPKRGDQALGKKGL